MTGGMKSVYLTEEQLRYTKRIKNFSKWVQKRIIEKMAQDSEHHRQTHHIKEKARWDNLIDNCLSYVKSIRASEKVLEFKYPHSTISIVEPWAQGHRGEIELLGLTPEQFVQKVLARESL